MFHGYRKRMSDNPYRDPGTPLSEGSPTTAPSSSSYWRFRSLNVLCLLATVGLIAHVSLLFFVSVLGVAGEVMFPGFSDPNQPIGSELEQAILYMQIGTQGFSFLVYVFNAVIVCMFMYRANANARSLGAANLANNPGWCVGYWFIPIITWFKPYQCMNEIYKASSNPNGINWKSAASHPLMGLWWTCWLISIISSNYENRMAFREVNLGVGGVVLNCVITLLFIAAAFSLVIILRSITSLQSNPRLQPQEKIGPIA